MRPRNEGEGLDATQFAVLAMLAVRPGSAYSLVKRMKDNYAFFWSRAESQLYSTVRALLDAGLITVLDDRSPRRARIEYRVSAAGERAIAAHLSTSGAVPRLEFEGMLHALHADRGTKAALLAQIAAVRDHARQMLALGRGVARDYLAGKVEFPERTHVGAVLWRFLWEFYEAQVRWADWASTEVEGWRRTRGDAANLASAKRMMTVVAGIDPPAPGADPRESGDRSNGRADARRVVGRSTKRRA